MELTGEPGKDNRPWQRKLSVALQFELSEVERRKVCSFGNNNLHRFIEMP
jgi:hypothetical protein